jgi:hypothetical protein
MKDGIDVISVHMVEVLILFKSPAVDPTSMLVAQLFVSA